MSDAQLSFSSPPAAHGRGLACLVLCMLIAALDTSIANAGLPTLGRAFAVPLHQVQWVVLAYLLTMTTLIVGAGRLGDLIGRRRMALAGQGLFILGSLVCVLAPGLEVLVLARALQGLGAAAMLAMATALVGTVVPKARSGRAMGLMGGMSALGTTLGPAVGGLLLDVFDWRALFLLSLPFSLLNGVLIWRTLPVDALPAGAGKARFDWVGTLVLAATLAAYALAMTLGRDGLDGRSWLLLAGAAGGLLLFRAVEARAETPLVRLGLVAQPSLRNGLIMSGLVATVVMATLVVGPFHLSGTLGLKAAWMGLALAAGPLAAAVAAVPAGRLVDRFGARAMTLAGLIGMLIGLGAVIALADPAFGLAGYVLPLMVVTAHYAVFQTANNTAVMALAASDQRGVVSGMLNLARNLGLITGASALGVIYAAAGLRMTFAACALLVTVGVLLAVRRPASVREAA